MTKKGCFWHLKQNQKGGSPERYAWLKSYFSSDTIVESETVHMCHETGTVPLNVETLF